VGVVHDQQTRVLPHIEQTFCNGVTHQLFNRIMHRTGAELWVKPLSHEERQHRFVEFQIVLTRFQEFDFFHQKLLCNFQLMLVAQPMEHRFLINSREDYQGHPRTSCCSYTRPSNLSFMLRPVISAVVAAQDRTKNKTRMKLIKQIKPLGSKIRLRLPSRLMVAAALVLNTLTA
jgi:hypothetical protein